MLFGSAGAGSKLMNSLYHSLNIKFYYTVDVNMSTDAVLKLCIQGTVLGPLLFLCYINDLPDLVISKIRLYADDVYFIQLLPSWRTVSNYNWICIHSLESWANIWQMQFNPDKCQHLRITNKHDFINFTYNICNCNIQTVDHAKYLGVIIDNHMHLSWSKHISQITKKALSVKAFLQRN